MNRLLDSTISKGFRFVSGLLTPIRAFNSYQGIRFSDAEKRPTLTTASAAAEAARQK